MNRKSMLQKLSREIRKERAVNYKGGVCVRCNKGLDEIPLEAFQFNHIDPSTKSCDPSSMKLLKWETMREELNKCELVCANCHSVITREQRTVSDWPEMAEALRVETGR